MKPPGSRFWLWVHGWWPFGFGEHFIWKRALGPMLYRPEKSEREHDTGVEDPHLWKISR